MFGRSKNKQVTYYKTDGKIGLKRGRKKITPPIYNKLKMPFDKQTGRTQAYINGKWGLIDDAGKEIIPFAFDSIEEPSYGYIVVKSNAHAGLYEEDGTQVLAPEYDNIGVYPLDCFAVKKSGKWGALTRKEGVLKSVIPLVFDALSYDGSIFFYVTKDGKTGITDIDGKELLAPVFEDVAEIASIPDEDLKLFRFSENGKYGIVTTFGDFIMGPKYDFIDRFVKKIARVKLNDKWGFIGIRGEVLVEPVYDELNQFNDRGEAACEYNGRKSALLRDALFRNRMPHQQNNT